MSDERRDQLDQGVDTTTWTANERAALAAYDEFVRAPVEPLEDFASAVVDRLETEQGLAPAVAAANSRLRWVRVAAVAAMCVALVGSGAAVATMLSPQGRVWGARPTLGEQLPPASAQKLREIEKADDVVSADPFPVRRSPGALPVDLGAEIDAYLADHGRRYGPAFRFHGVVSVSRGGEVVEVARGRGGVDEGAPTNTAHTRFKLGSLSQQCLSVAAMRMVERGELALGDRVGEVLEGFRGPGRAVTLEQLLSHTSGIPSFTDNAAWPAVRGGELGPLQLRSMFEALPLEFEPGTRFEPSNSNYLLVGQMLEARAGDTLDRIMVREVFEPAGMEHTTIGDPPIGAVAQGQEFDELEVLKPGVAVHARAMGGAGGVVSNVADLRRFDRALRRGALLGPAARRELFSPRQGNYALGWIVDETVGQPSVAHPGGVDGNNHHLLRLADGTTIIVLANTEVVDARDVAADVAALAYDRAPVPRVEFIEKATAHRLLHYTGRWRLTEASRRAYTERVDPERLALLDDVRIYLDEDILWFEVAGYGRKWMHPKGGDAFFFKDRAAGRAAFGGIGPDGRPDQLEIREGSVRFLLERWPE